MENLAEKAAGDVIMGRNLTNKAMTTAFQTVGIYHVGFTLAPETTNIPLVLGSNEKDKVPNGK